MKKSENLIKYLILLSLIILISCKSKYSESINSREDKSIIFPVRNKVFQYNTEADNLDVILETDNFFSINSFNRNDSIYLQDRKSSKLLIYKMKKLKNTGIDDFSNVYITNNYLLKISKIYQKTGFECEIFKITENNKFQPVNKFTLDLFISDYEIIDDYIFFCGSSENNSKNLLYKINLNNNSKKIIFENAKNNDFFKICISDKNLILYSSSTNFSKNNYYYIFFCEELFKNNFKYEKKMISSGNLNSFYGKGFYFNETYYLPMIDEDHEMTLSAIENDFSNCCIYNLPTAVYKVIGKNKNDLFFIGYNYLKNRTNFSLLCFNDLEKKIIFNIEL